MAAKSVLKKYRARTKSRALVWRCKRADPDTAPRDDPWRNRNAAFTRQQRGLASGCRLKAAFRGQCQAAPDSNSTLQPPLASLLSPPMPRIFDNLDLELLPALIVHPKLFTDGEEDLSFLPRSQRSITLAAAQK